MYSIRQVTDIAGSHSSHTEKKENNIIRKFAYLPKK